MNLYQKDDNYYILLDEIEGKENYEAIVANFKKRNITITSEFISNYCYCIEVIVDKYFIDGFIKNVALRYENTAYYYNNSVCIWRELSTYGDFIYYANIKDNKFYVDFEGIGD